MSAVEVRDRLADRFRLLQGGAPGPERQHTLRHAVDWSYDLLTDDERALLRATSVFAGGFDLTSIAPSSTTPTRSTCCGTSTRSSASRSSSPTTPPPARATACSRRSASSPRTASPRPASASERATGTPPTSRARPPREWDRWDGPGWRDAVDWVELELGNLRAGFRWSAERGEVEVATDIAAHAALMGFSVQLFETLAWAEELLDAASAADVAGSRACTPRRLRLLRRPAEAARANAHRATELEADARYDPCEPGYATFIEALGQVYCGDLDRYIELTGEVARRYGAERGYGLASYVDGLQSAGRVEEALALTEESVAAARALGNPYWISYALWIAGMAFSRSDRPAGAGGLGRGGRLRPRAPRPVLRGLPRPRRGPPAHLRRRARGGAGAVRARPSTRSTAPATSRS